MQSLEKFLDLLKCVVKCIDLYDFKEERKQEEKELKQKYQNIVECEEEEKFYAFIEKEYGTDRETQALLLQYISEIIGFSKPDIKFLEYRLEQELLGDGDLFLELNLWNQIKDFLFYEGMAFPFQKEWEINERIAKKLRERFSFSYEKICKKDRREDFVVITVKQFLSILHSPTKLVLEIARIIQKYLGKKVLIVSFTLITDPELLRQAGVKGTLFINNCGEQSGDFQVEYKGERIDVCQVSLERNNAESIKKVIDEIFQLKPFCVWNMASEPSLAMILNEFTTGIYTRMTQGYPPVNVDFIVNYIPVRRQEEKERKKFLLEKNIKVMETEFLFPYEKPCGKVSRIEIGVPEDAFCLGIVGTRLLGECTDEFLKAMDGIVGRDKEIFVLFLGFSEEEDVKFERKLKMCTEHFKNYKCLGATTELMEHLALIDIFVNPPRMGGGNTGAMALSIGVPVVSLKKGDIAGVAGEEFTVDALRDYADVIFKYKNDPGFYQGQSRLAMERIQEKTTDDAKLAEIVQNVFDGIE